VTMSHRKRGLGKNLSDLGLSELLGDMNAIPEPIMANMSVEEESSQGDFDHQLKKISVHSMTPGPYQPRKTMTESGLEELANSIKKQGVIQPIVVRKNAQQQYEIIAGERRWRAAQKAGLEYVPVIIRDISNEAAMAMALIENIQRQDLNAIEEAAALQRLLTEFSMTHQEVADAVGKSRTNVTNLLRLLKLNDDVRGLVEKGHLDMGHARALLSLEPEQQSEIANIIVARVLSVRETEDLIRKVIGEDESKKPNVSSSKKVVLSTLQERLTQKIGAKVSITQNTKGRGKLVIKYNSEAELEGILTHLQ